MKKRRNLLVIVAVLEVVLAYGIYFAFVGKVPPFAFFGISIGVFLGFQLLLGGGLYLAGQKTLFFSLFRRDLFPLNLVMFIPFLKKPLEAEAIKAGNHTHAPETIEDTQLGYWTTAISLYTGTMKVVLFTAGLADSIYSAFGHETDSFTEALPIQMFIFPLIMCIMFQVHVKRGALKGKVYGIDGDALLLPIFNKYKKRRIPLAQIKTVDLQWHPFFGYFLEFNISGRNEPLIHSAIQNHVINWPAIKADIEGHLPQNQPEPEYA